MLRFYSTALSVIMLTTVACASHSSEEESYQDKRQLSAKEQDPRQLKKLRSDDAENLGAEPMNLEIRRVVPIDNAKAPAAIFNPRYIRLTSQNPAHVAYTCPKNAKARNAFFTKNSLAAENFLDIDVSNTIAQANNGSLDSQELLVDLFYSYNIPLEVIKNEINQDVWQKNVIEKALGAGEKDDRYAWFAVRVFDWTKLSAIQKTNLYSAINKRAQTLTHDLHHQDDAKAILGYIKMMKIKGLGDNLPWSVSALLLHASELGSHLGSMGVADYYLGQFENSKPRENNPTKAFQNIEAAAYSTSLPAVMYRLSEMFEHGIGTPANLIEALRWNYHSGRPMRVELLRKCFAPLTHDDRLRLQENRPYAYNERDIPNHWSTSLWYDHVVHLLGSVPQNEATIQKLGEFFTLLKDFSYRLENSSCMVHAGMLRMGATASLNLQTDRPFMWVINVNDNEYITLGEADASLVKKAYEAVFSQGRDGDQIDCIPKAIAALNSLRCVNPVQVSFLDDLIEALGKFQLYIRNRIQAVSAHRGALAQHNEMYRKILLSDISAE